jgi:hypothetical protein
MTAQGNPVAGAIQAIAVDPNNANTLYVGTVNGGVWKTTQDQSSSPQWTTTTDLFPSLSISALAFNPGGTTLYAGTGNFSSAGQGDQGAGLLKTTDGGAHWTVLGTERFIGLSIRAIAAEDPVGATQVVLVAAVDPLAKLRDDEGGIFRSTDGGAHWTRLSGSPATGRVNSASNLPPGSATAVVLDPAHAHAFYAAIAGNATFSKGIYYSDTLTGGDGAVWRPTTRPLPPLPSESIDPTQRILLSVSEAPGHPLYAAYVAAGYVSGVFRTGDQGQHWQEVTNVPTLNTSGQGDLHLSLQGDRTDSNVFYMGGETVKVDNISAGNLYRVSASSNTWVPIVGPSMNGAGASNSAPHPDSRQMALDRNGDLLEADDGGVYRLTAPLDNPDLRGWVSLNGNLSITEIHSVAYDALNNVLFAGSQDNGVEAQSAAGNPTWQAVVRGDGLTVATVNLMGSPAVTTRFFMLNNFGAFFRERFSSADANPPAPVKIALAKPKAGADALSGLTDEDQHFQDVARIPYAVNAVDPSRLLLGFNGLYESYNQGDTINQLDGSKFGTPEGQGLVTALAYGGWDAGRPEPNVLYAARGSTIYVRQPDGQVRSKSTGGTDVTSIVLDPDNWQVAYAVDRQKVWTTTDGGTTWNSITGSLDELHARPLKCVQLIKTTSGDKVLLVGGLGGVYRLLNPGTGTEWRLFGTDLPNVLVTDVEYYAPRHLLMAATFGRGVWTIAGSDDTFLTSSPTLEVRADAGMNTTLSIDPDNPSLLDVNVGSGPTAISDSFRLATVGLIDVQSANGTTITIDSTNGLINPRVDTNVDIHVDGGGTGSDLVFMGRGTAKSTPTPASPSTPTTWVIEKRAGKETVEFVNVAPPAAPILVTEDTLPLLRDSWETVVDPNSSELGDSSLLGAGPPVLLASLERALSGDSSGSPAIASAQGGGILRAAILPAATGPSGFTEDTILGRLLDSGQGAFPLADIGSTIATLDDLRNQLDALDNIPGNVTFTQANGVTRFDVQVHKTLSGTADLNLDGLGGSLNIGGSIDVSADVALHIVFGVDANGFFIDPRGTSDPLLTVSNLQIDGNVQGAGQFGFLDVTLNGATLTVDPAVQITVQLQTPANSPDGLIRLDQLTTESPSLFAATITGNPNGSDVVLTGNFSVDAVLPGGTSLIPDLANAQVTFTWPHVDHPTDVRVTATAGPGQDLLDFLNVSTAQVADGLSTLAGVLQPTTGFDLFGQNIPLLNKSLGQILGGAQDLPVNNTAVVNVSTVYPADGFSKFDVVLSGLNLQMMNVAPGDSVTYNMANGDSLATGIVDAVDAGTITIRFDPSLTQPPDPQNLSLVVHTVGSLQHQLNSFLGTLANPVQLSAQVPTLQSLTRKLRDILGIDVSQIGLNITGSGTGRVVQITPDLTLQPITFTQSLDLSTAHVPGLNLSTTGSTFSFTVTPHLHIPFGIRLDPSLAADRRFFLVPDSTNALFSLQVDATFDPNVTGTIGFLNVALQDGSSLAAAPNNHGISIHGNVSLFLKDPGSDGDQLITLDELQNVLQQVVQQPSVLGNLFDPQISADVFAGLQIQAKVGDTTDVTDTLGALKIGLHDPSGRTVAVHIAGQDLQLPSLDVYTDNSNTDSSNFENFANLTPDLIVQGFQGLFTQLGLLGSGSAFDHALGILPINLKNVLSLDQRVSGALKHGGPQVSDVLDAQHLLDYFPAGAATLTVNPSDLRVHFHVASDFTTQPTSFSLGLGGNFGHLVSTSVTGIPPLHLHAQADLTVGIKTDANTPLFDRFFLDTSSTTGPSGAVIHATDIQVAAVFDAGYDLTAAHFTSAIAGSPLSISANVGPLSITANGSRVLVRVGLDVAPDNATHEVTLTDLPSIFTAQNLPLLTGCMADPQSPGRDVPIPDPNAPADVQAYLPVKVLSNPPTTIVVLGQLADITNLQVFPDDPNNPIPISVPIPISAPPTPPADLSNTPPGIYIQDAANLNPLNGIDPVNVDVTTLLNGLGTLTGLLANALNGPLGQISFPLIGRLHNGAAFVTDLNNTIHTALSALNSFTDQDVTDALLQAFDPAPTASNPNPPQLIPSGAIHVEHNSEHAQFDFGIHEVYPLASVSLATDFGIPGLHLTVSPTSTLNVSLVIDFAFGIGYSAEDGFYFDTNASNLVTAGADGQTPLTHTLQIGLVASVTSNDPSGQIATGQLASLLNVSLFQDGTAALFNAQGGFVIDVHGPSESSDSATHRLTLSELGDLPDLVNADFAGSVNADVHLQVDFGSGSMFPSISTNLKVGWQFGGGDLSGGIPSVTFDAVTLDLGTFFSRFVGPILYDVQAVLKPFAPLVHFITARIPVISDLRGRDTSLLDLAQESGQVSPEALIVTHIVQSLVDSPPSTPSADGVQIRLGSFSLGGVDLRTGDESTASIEASPDATTDNVDSQLQDAPLADGFLKTVDDTARDPGADNVGLQFPLLKNPTSAFKLLLGRPVDLVTFTLPDANLPLVHENELFHIFGPIFVRLIGDVSLHTNLTVGYDTRGLSEFLNSHHAADLLDGFFVKDDAYAQVRATIEADLEVNVIVASAGVGGGINGTFSLGLHDPRSANQDHKIYWSQIFQDLSNDVFCIFDLHGTITAYLHVYVRVGIDTPFGFVGWSDTKDLAKTTFDFDLHCNSTMQAAAPILGHVDNGVLTLFMGPKAGMRQNVGAFNQDGDETFIVSQTPGGSTDPNNETVDVTFLTIDQNGIPHSFKQTNIHGVREIYAEGGMGNNSITIKPDVTAQAVLFGHFDPNDPSLTPDQRSYTGGDDTIVAGGGNTTMYGGGANDLLTAGATGNDEIHGGQNATIHGGGGHDLLYGGTGHNEIYGGTGVSTLTGGNGGDNVLQAGTGDDVLYGGSMASNTYVIDNSRAAGGSPLLASKAGGIVVHGSGTSNVLHLVNGAGAGFTETYTPGTTPDAGKLVTGNGTVSQTVHFDGFAFTAGASQISAAIVDEVPVDQFTYDDSGYTGGLQIVNADVGAQAPGGQALSTATQTLIAPTGATALSTNVSPFSFDHKVSVTVKGGKAITLDNSTSADGMTSLTSDSGQAGATVNVLSTAARATTVTQSQQGLAETVNVGRNGSVAAIQGALTIANASAFSTTLSVDDSADPVGKVAIVSDTAITGLAPAAINYTTSILNGLSISGGSGGNQFGVYATGAGYTTTLTPGSGLDNVSVGTAPLTGGSIVDYIQGDLVINDKDGLDGLTVDDSGSRTDKTGTLTATTLSGLGMGGTITYPQDLGVILFLGSGTNTLNVFSTSASTYILGNGPNTIHVGVEKGLLFGINGDLTVDDSGRFTTLYVDDSSDPTNKTPTISTLKPKGDDPNSIFGEIKDLAPALIRFQTTGMQAVYVTGGRGVNRFSVQDTGAGYTTTLNPGSNMTVSPNAVTVTNNGSVQGILGELDIQDLTPTVLTVDDSADPTGQYAFISDSAITSLAPAVIQFLPAALQALSVSGGSGGNTFNVTATDANYATTLNPGNHATHDGAADYVNVGNNGSAQVILGTLSIQNETGLTTLSVDDSADSSGRNPVISNGSVTGVAPAAILFDPLGLQALNVSGGTGLNTWSVLSTGAGYTTLLTTRGFDTVALGTSNLDDLQGAITVNAFGGGTGVNVNDQSGPTTATDVLTASTYRRANFGGLTYSNVGNLTVNVVPGIALGGYRSSQNVIVTGTHANTTTTINAANGANNITVGLPTNPAINTTGLPGSPLENIQGPLTLNGDYMDILTLWDWDSSSAQKTYAINTNSIAVTTLNGVPVADPVPISWQGRLSVAVLYGSAAADTYHLLGQSGNMAALVVDGYYRANTFQSFLPQRTWAIYANQAIGSYVSGLGAIDLGEVWNFTGGPGHDDFLFAPNYGTPGSLNGVLNGGGGGTLDYSLDTSPVTVNLANDSATNIDGGAAGGFSNIQNVIGNGTSTTLVGPDQVGLARTDYWNITGANTGNLLAPAPNQPGPFTFSQVPNLTGGAGNDILQFGPGATITGVLDGGGGVNTLDYSQYTVGVTVNLTGQNTPGQPDPFGGVGAATGTSGVRHIQNAIGTPFDDTLIGDDEPNVFVGHGGNDLMVGNGGNDTFRFDTAPGPKTQVYGGTLAGQEEGSDVLWAADVSNDWELTGPGTGTVNGIPFYNVENLLGGQQDDTFHFHPGASFSGYVNGNRGNNTLDYSAYGSPVTVNLGAPWVPRATGTGFIVGFQTFIGSSATNTLIGRNQDATWQLNATGNSTLTYGATVYQFSSFGNLQGGTGVDVFRFGPGASVNHIDGGGAPAGKGDWLDYTAYDAGVYVDLKGRKATGAFSGVVNIQNVFGGYHGNTLIGGALGDILVGRTGMDVLGGGAGRNLLIGGPGRDRIFAGPSDDILIAGYTDYDYNAAALMDILAEWQRTDPGEDYLTRIAHIRAGVGRTRAHLTANTVHDDGVPNQLVGGPGQDWFWANLDHDGIVNLRPDEVVN